MPSPIQTEFLTVAEVAEKLNVGRGVVYRLVASRQVAAVRLGSGPNPPIRVSEVELERYVRASTIGGDLHERATRILTIRGIDPEKATADEYREALEDAGDYASAVFVDKVAADITADVDRAQQRGYFARASAPSSDAVDIEKIIREEFDRLGDPLPPEIGGTKAVDLAARRIMRQDGIVEFDSRVYRAAVRQAIQALRNPKRKV